MTIRAPVRALIVTAATVAVVLGGAGCGADRSGPQQLGEDLAQGFNDRDPDALRELTCEREKDGIDELGLDGETVDFTAEFSGVGTPSDDTAIVTVTLVYDEPPEELTQLGVDSVPLTFAAVKENGKWVACGFAG